MEVRIVGMLEDNAKIVGYTDNTFRNAQDYSDIYCDYSLENENVPILLMDAQSIKSHNEKYELEAFVSGWSFVTFSENITETEIIQNEQTLSKYAQFRSKEDLTNISANSRNSLREKNNCHSSDISRSICACGHQFFMFCVRFCQKADEKIMRYTVYAGCRGSGRQEYPLLLPLFLR